MSLTAPSDGIIGRLGRYELLDRIGHGGMGEVFLARATGAAGFTKKVVIKRILPHLADNPQFVQRLVDEGKLVARLRHAGIAQVYDLGEEAGSVYLSMEYVEGRDLRELMRLAQAADLQTPVPVAVSVVVAVLDALDYAHRLEDDDNQPLHIIHRDVSPSNVMISRAGEVKLLDFGIARARDRLHLSISGAIQGKFSYMSPEQAAGREMDARSDQFSLGVMAWELLVGSRPFDGDTDLQTLDRIRHFEPGSLADHLADVPTGVAEAVDRMLKKQPDERFATCDDAQRALHEQLMRTGALVGGRERASWVTEILATLPEGLRDRPMAGLSLDDALRLGLDGAAQGGTATLGTPAVPVGTVSATLPASDHPEQGVKPALVPSAATPVVVTAPPQPMGTQAKLTPAPRSRSFRMKVARWVFNAAVVGSFIFLYMTRGNDLAPTPTNVPGPVSQDAARSQRPDLPASEDSGPASDAVVDTLTPPVATSDAGGSDLVDVSLLPDSAGEADAPNAATDIHEVGTADAGADVRPEVKAGKKQRVTIRTDPPGAVVHVRGFGKGKAPRTVRVRSGESRSGWAKLAGHQTKRFTVRSGRRSDLIVKLQPSVLGSVAFRFVPANAKVLIDGKPVSPGGSNIVKRKLSVGRHRVVVVAPNGAKKSEAFTVEAHKVTNLGTLTAKTAITEP